MTKKLKYLALSICMAFLGFGALGMSALNVSSAAAEEIVLTAETYTDSDRLLKANGTLSDKKISDFASDVKIALDNASFPELTEVIPTEYLESTQTNDTFYYNGKEYGFYVAKEGNYFDVLLLDFKYEFDNGRESDIEYKIRIEPILQQSFYRTQTLSGEYEWRKYIGSGERYAYYVANPRFLTFVQNENALNYGDDGYSKYNDEGVIILQSRANYGKISYKTETDLLGEVAEFAGEQILDAALEVADLYTYGIASEIATAIEFGANLYKESKEVTVETNNEKNIFTRQSKTAQRDNDLIDGYSRVAGFRPTEEIVLSADVNSYAEFITVLGDANYRARLSEFCDFDIVRRIPDSFTSMQYVTGAEENRAFSFDKVNVLYDDKTITGLDSAAITQETLAYLLKDGTHKFAYNCTDTTSYQILADTALSNIEVYCGSERISTTKVNSNTVEFALEKGKNYNFIFSQENASYYNFTFCKKSENIASFGDRNIGTLKLAESKWYKYVPQNNKYISIEYDESKYNLDVFCVERNDYIELNGVQNQKEFYAEQGNTYYISLANGTTTELQSNTWSFNEVSELPCNGLSNSFAVNEERVFKFVAPVEGKYAITGLPSGLTATIDGAYDGNNYILSAGKYYVTIKGNSASATCNICFVAQTATVGTEITVSGNTRSAFVKFVPSQTLNYNLTLPTNVKLEQVINGNVINNTNATSNIKLNANTTYYFRVVAVSGNLPSSFEVSIQPQTIDSVTVNADTGVGSKTITGSGTQVVEIIINETNIYNFSGMSNPTLYNQYLQAVGSNSVLTAGRYYLKANFVSGTTYNLTISKTGLDMQIGDVIGVTGSATYRYQLELGKKYEIRIGASEDHTFTTAITLKNSLGGTCTVTKANDYYTFTANDTTMFVNLTMSNISGQSGIFTLLEENSTSGSIIQTIQPDRIYPLATDQSQCIIKIPSGTYTLYVQKKIGETVRLYELDRNKTDEFIGTIVDGTTIQNSIAVKYSLSYTTEKVFILYSDNNEVDCVLSYADSNSEYRIGIKDESGQNTELSIYNSYEFALYRYTNGTQFLVSDITSEDFTVYQGSPNGTVVNSDNGVYAFNNTDKVYVTINFFGIQALSEYTVVKPKVEGRYEVTTSGLYFKTSTLNYSSNEYAFENMKLTLIGNNATRFSTTYTYVISSRDITSYVWDKSLSMKVEFTYSNGVNTVVFSDTFTYTVPYYQINNSISLGSNEIAIIDASLLTSNSYNANKTITIPSTMKQIFFLGVTNKKVVDLDIVVADRSASLGMYMKNFSYTFKEKGLYIEGYSTLNLNITGVCSIYPKSATAISGYGLYGYYVNILGTGELSVKAGKQQSYSVYSSTEGIPGICAYNLTISVNKLYAKGGAGGDSPNATGTEYADDLRGKSANPGGVGGYAIFATAKLNVTSSCKTLILEGGDGGNGGNGADGLNGTSNFEAGGRGGHGGDGGSSGFYYHQNLNSSSVSFPSTTTVEYIDGIRGNGGRGGNGGNGGRGGNGGNGGNGGEGYIGGIGGNGGHGGNGVDDTDISGKPSTGGNGGNGGHGGYSYRDGVYVKPGDGGDGGNGGDPGGWGHGLAGGNGGYGYHGGDGGDGSDANLVFSLGGDAGDGGNAYGGIVGAAGSVGDGVWSSDGTPGNQGTSYSSYQNYPWNY